FMLADDNTPTNRYRHAPLETWYDETTRLYRLLELLEIKDRMAGTTDSGRTAGKVNINSIWDFETFLALCDPGPGNNFTPADVKVLWDKLIALRSPIYANPVNMGKTFTQVGTLVGPTNLTGVQLDRPFLGQAVGFFPPGTSQYSQYPQGQGI